MIKFNKTVISGIASVLPERRVSSDEIELKLERIYRKLKLPFGRLELMTGITERRVWDSGTRPSSLSTMAAEKLLNKIDVDREKIGLLIHASVCRDFLEPATASVVHSNLNLSFRCQNYDLSNACLGVLNAIISAGSMIETGAINHALIVSGENAGPLIEKTIQHINSDNNITRKSIKKYMASLTIGSAAVAIMLSNREIISDGHQIKLAESVADTKSNYLCQGSGDINSLMMETNSEELMQTGLRLSEKNWSEFKKNMGWDNSNIDWAISHQVGHAHEQGLIKALGIEEIKTFSTYKYLGNTGSCALPITLDHLNNEKPIEKDDKIALLGIGSGLNSIIMGVQW